jgi:hypothetical protein
VTLNSANSGGSYFHQFAARMQKRFSSGLQFSVNFQHSRLMEKNSRLNASDPTLEKRISSSDRPNRAGLQRHLRAAVWQGQAFRFHAPAAW